uniref:phenylalanine--tRNA ligase n=1 Tax=Corynoplastis japonica TaxID=700918 RepID=A0A1X9PTV7_9RHOD|nr:phenylalanyl tRNA synthetase beta subunit [Corynoplastis japonica]
MKISWNWLNTVIDINDIGPEELSNQLTLVGFEIENIVHDNYFGVNDVVLDIALTSNRSDLLSLLGIAREVSAGQPFNLIDVDTILNQPDSNHSLEFEIKFAQDKDQFYINNQLIRLTSQNLITTCNNIPVELSGIISNSKYNINNKSQSIFIYSTVLNSRYVRSSTRQLGLRTESSIRHERGTNIEQWNRACTKLTHLIKQLVSCNISNHIYFLNEHTNLRSIVLNKKNIYNVLGPIHNKNLLSIQNIEYTLNSLGFKVENNTKSLTITVPSHRFQEFDLFLDLDIIEEIGRLVGFNNFIDDVPLNKKNRKLSQREVFIRNIRASLKQLGLTEVITNSLIKLDNKNPTLQLTNPLNSEVCSLRTSLLTNMLRVCNYNLNKDNHILECFEFGRVFNSKLFKEHDSLAAVIGGNLLKSNWKDSPRQLTWSEAKGIIEICFKRLHPVRNTVIKYHTKEIGCFIQLHPNICKNFGNNLYAFELNIDKIYALRLDANNNPNTFLDYSQYPSVCKDISLIIPFDLSIKLIIQTIKDSNIQFLESVEVFDEYITELTSQGYHSVALRVYYRSMTQTLTSAQVDNLHNEIISMLIHKFSIQLRST